MKEVFQNVADREKMQILNYLGKALAYMQANKIEEDASFALELLIERLQEKQLGRDLEFRTRDIGL